MNLDFDSKQRDTVILAGFRFAIFSWTGLCFRLYIHEISVRFQLSLVLRTKFLSWYWIGTWVRPRHELNLGFWPPVSDACYKRCTCLQLANHGVFSRTGVIRNIDWARFCITENVFDKSNVVRFADRCGEVTVANSTTGYRSRYIVHGIGVFRAARNAIRNRGKFCVVSVIV